MDFSAFRTSSFDRAAAFFYKKEQVESLHMLATSFEERISFANFIKEGSWLDEICLNRNFRTDVRSRRGSLLKASIVATKVGITEPEILYDYFVPTKEFSSIKEKLIKLIEEEDEEPQEEDSGKTSFSKGSARISFTSSRRSSLDSTKTTILEGGGVGGAWLDGSGAMRDSDMIANFHGDYADLEHSAADTGFTKYQMLAILFLTLHPLYLKSKTRSELNNKQSSKFCFMDQYGQCRCLVPCAEPSMSSAEACKAEELLLSAAAYFDEERMLRVLSYTSWIKQIPHAIEHCPLGVSVCDARGGGGFPITYVNQAMQSITGYSDKAMLGKTFKMLQGKGTEPEQVVRMSIALCKQCTVRVALTNYRKNGTPYMNMLVLKPIFDTQNKLSCVVGVSFDISRREASIQELQQVDVILALLPLILTCHYDKPQGHSGLRIHA
jgi:PAS domain S-box-containing protein